MTDFFTYHFHELSLLKNINYTKIWNTSELKKCTGYLHGAMTTWTWKATGANNTIKIKISHQNRRMCVIRPDGTYNPRFHLTVKRDMNQDKIKGENNNF